ncbi:MAG: PAS domain S-box protein [Desulfomonilaceae bacterium]|nr:PAS domain S-box protein [Desulfomonilaceae bacterium]
MTRFDGPEHKGDETFLESEAQARIRAALIRQLYSQIRPGMYAAAAGAIVLSILVWNGVSHYLVLGWLAVFLAAQVPRHLLVRKFFETELTDAEVAPWGTRFLVGSAATAALWGGAGILFFVPHDFFYQSMLAIVLAGTAASTAVAHAPLKECYISSVVLTLAPILGRIVWQGEEHGILLSIAGLIFLAALLGTGRSVHRTLADTILLRWEKDALVDALRQSRDSLEERVRERTVQFEEITEELQREISERREAEETLTQEKERFQVLAENLPLGLVTISEQGEFLYANRKFTELFGYELRDVPVGREWFLKAYPDSSYRRHVISCWIEDLDKARPGELRPREFNVTCIHGIQRTILFRTVQLGTGQHLMTCEDVTEQRKLEAERDRLFNLSMDMLCVAGFDGYFKQVNPAWTRTLGWSEEEILSRRWIELVHPEDRQATLSAGDALRAGRPVHFFGNRYLSKDGTYRRLSWNSFPVLEEQLIFAVVRDVTEQVQADEELAKAQALLEAAVQNTPAGVLIAATPDVRIQIANRAALEMLGDTRDPLTDIPIHLHSRSRKVFTPDGSHFPDEELPLSQAVLYGRTSRNVEAIIRKGTGEDRWVLVNAAPVSDQEGNTVAGVAVITDITDRKRVEDELRASESKYRTILETIADGYHETDIAGNLTLVNDSLCEIAGYERQELIGMNYRGLMDPHTARHVYEAYNKVYRTGIANPDFRTEIVRKDGTRKHVSASISPIRDGNHDVIGFRGMFRDTTEVMQLEQQLRHAVKMEAIGQLAGGVAHDFNNLLTAMIGYSDLLAKELPDGAPYMDRVIGIRNAARSAAGLTQQLLAFSRKQVLDVKVMDLNELIAGLEGMLRRLIGEDVDLTTSYGSSLGFVKADPGQVEQVLVNLTVNSRDAMPEGGTLTIETANVFLDDNYAESHAEVRPGPYVMAAVSDNGTGIEPELLTRVFDPFFTTKKQGSGTGLGLSTVYGIVKQHSGHVSVYSEKNAGTTFKVYLPRVDGDAERRPRPTVPAEVRGGVETILVVEDEETVRNLVSEALEELGYTVVRVGSPEEAIRTSADHPGPIHLLLTDVVLPQMDGKSLFEFLAPSRPDMKVLYISGYTENFIVRRGVLEPGIHFLQKPFTVDDLARKVREALKA